MGNNNGVASVIEFVDFRVEIEGVQRFGIWRRDIFREVGHGGTIGLEETEEGMAVSFGRIIREYAVSDSIRQLSVFQSKIIILVEDHSGTALIFWGISIYGLDLREWRAWHSSTAKQK